MLGRNVQLFVDDFLVDRTQRVWRTLNGGYNTRPRKVAENPIVKPDRPWEGFLVLQPGSVIYDEESQLFKMWYNTLPTMTNSAIQQFICYAISEDGIHWEKPDLNLVDFKGSKANNIVLRWSSWNHSVIKDQADPDADRRYKMAYWQTHDREKCGVWAAFSPDGIHWTDHPGNPVVPCWASGDTFSVMRDPGSGQYWLYHKTSPGGPRKVSRLASDDFIHWSDDRLVLEPDEHDPPDTEFYGLSAFPYGGQYLGLLWVFHTSPQTMDAQLVSSRDGVHWERGVYRRMFLVLGYMVNQYSGQSFDSGMVFPVTAPVVRDGQLWIYYSGFDNLHNAPARKHTGQIGLVKIRRDGFSSFDATSEGYVLTRPLRFEGNALYVNVELLPGAPEGPAARWKGLFNQNAAAAGYLKVELQNEGGDPISGFEAADAKLIPEGDTYSRVSWGDAEIGALSGEMVRLKFVFSRAKLYSFQIR